MKKNNLKKGFVLPLVIAIVAILAIGGTVYLTTKEKVEAPVTDSVDVTDWKTYKNEKYGFEFKYPADWKIIPDSVFEKGNDLGFYKGDVRVMGVENPIREIGYHGLDLLRTEQIKIINNDFPLVKTLYVDDEDKMYRYIHISWAPSDWSMSGELWFTFRDGDMQREKEINQIISSLFFISPEPKTTTACTKDAMMCPDGSYVGRIGPKCEFVCPISDLLKICPDSKFTNKMPGPGTGTPSSYYILDGKRRELTEFDQNWVAANCVVKEYSAY
jgi:hypothetical protein